MFQLLTWTDFIHCTCQLDKLRRSVLEVLSLTAFESQHKTFLFHIYFNNQWLTYCLHLWSSVFMAAKILSSLLKKCLEITTALTAEYTQRLTMLLQHSSSLPSLHPLKSSIKKLTCHGGQLHGWNPSDPLPAALPLSIMARQSYAANTMIHKLSIFTNS